MRVNVDGLAACPGYIPSFQGPCGCFRKASADPRDTARYKAGEIIDGRKAFKVSVMELGTALINRPQRCLSTVHFLFARSTHSCARFAVQCGSDE